MDMPMPSLLETTTSIWSPNAEDQDWMALPAVAASQVAPDWFFISCEASSRMVYSLPSSAVMVASWTRVEEPSTLVPIGVGSMLPSTSMPVPSALRVPRVRAMESLWPMSPTART